MGRGKGGHLGKGIAKERILLILLNLEKPVKTSDIMPKIKKELDLKQNKNVHNHLNSLWKKELLHKESKTGLDDVWSIKLDFLTAKKIYYFMDKHKSKALKTKYFQSLITTEFLEQAVNNFLTNSNNNLLVKVSKSKVVQNQDLISLMESFNDISIMGKVKLTRLVLWWLVPQSEMNNMKEMLKCSPTAISFLFDINKNKYIWRYIDASLIKSFEPIFQAIFKSLIAYAKSPNRTKIKIETTINAKEIELALKPIIERKETFFCRFIESMFITDILNENVAESPFLIEYVEKKLFMVSKI